MARKVLVYRRNVLNADLQNQLKSEKRVMSPADERKLIWEFHKKGFEISEARFQEILSISDDKLAHYMNGIFLNAVRIPYEELPEHYDDTLFLSTIIAAEKHLTDCFTNFLSFLIDYEDSLDYIFGNTVFEKLPRVLARIGIHHFSTLQEHALNPEFESRTRALFVHAIAEIALVNHVHREEAVLTLREVLKKKLHYDDLVYTTIIILDAGFTEVQPEITALLETDLAVEEIFQHPGDREFSNDLYEKIKEPFFTSLKSLKREKDF